jgi:predicted nicotinamide N-methyase
MTGLADAEAFIRAGTALAHPPLVPEIALHLATEITPLWQATQDALDDDGLEPPFWAFAWPGGQAMARHLLDNPATVAGRRVLDICSGSGIAAIAAARAGAASVTAADIDPLAVAAIALNAAENGVAIEITCVDLLASPPAGWEVVIAGDVCYERPLADRIVPWLRAAAGGGALVLIGDPGRAYLPAEGREEIACLSVPTSLELEDSEIRVTRLWRMLP